jgi:Secretion system C-terminal sorting domain
LLYKFIAYNQDLFAGTDSGFYYSTNSGATWTQANQGLQLVPGDHVNAIVISGGNIVIGTNSSNAWYRKLSDFGVSSVAATPAPNVGLNLALSQNPASSSQVKVTYTMSDDGTAQVMLMDELGRSVRMLQNGPAIPGENMLTIDPLTLAAGTYFVRLTADGATAMQKLVITR